MSYQQKEQALLSDLGNQMADWMEAVDENAWKPPYAMGSVGDEARNPLSLVTYSGINNTLRPTMMQQIKGYPTNEWVTYHQAKENKTPVRKGEKGIPIIRVVTHLKKDAKDESDTYTTLMVYTAFNVAQLDGWQYAERQPDKELPPLAERLERGYERIKAQGARIVVGNPMYEVAYDTVSIPLRQHFYEVDTGAAHPDEHRLSVLLHEMAHREGHPTRLNRPLLNRFGTPPYAREEMTAQWAAIDEMKELELYPSQKALDFDLAYMKGWFVEQLRKNPLILAEIAGDARAIRKNWQAQYERYLADPSIIDGADELPEIDFSKQVRAVRDTPVINLSAIRDAGLPQTINMDRDIYFDEKAKQWTDRPAVAVEDPFVIPDKVWANTEDKLPPVIQDKVPDHQKPGGELEKPTADQLWIKKVRPKDTLPDGRPIEEAESVDELLGTNTERSFASIIREEQEKASKNKNVKGAA